MSSYRPALALCLLAGCTARRRGPGFQELGALVHRPDDGALILAGMSSAEFTIGDTALPGRIFLAALDPDLAPETAAKSQ